MAEVKRGSLLIVDDEIELMRYATLSASKALRSRA